MSQDSELSLTQNVWGHRLPSCPSEWQCSRSQHDLHFRSLYCFPRHLPMFYVTYQQRSAAVLQKLRNLISMICSIEWDGGAAGGNIPREAVFERRMIVGEESLSFHQEANYW